MKKCALAFISIVVLAGPLMSQTSPDIAAKYPSITGYMVRPDVLMTLSYTPQGEVCEVSLERRHNTGKAVNLDEFLSTEQVQQLLDEIVPPAKRGKRQDGVLDGTTMVNGITTVTWYIYENITVELHGVTEPQHGNMVAIINWRNRVCAPQAADVKDHH